MSRVLNARLPLALFLMFGALPAFAAGANAEMQKRYAPGARGLHQWPVAAKPPRLPA